MLYNVVLGDHRHVPDKWKLIEDGGFYFYEKADLQQRIRLSKDFGVPEELQYQWGTDTIQCYEFENDPNVPEKRWRNNTSNMNPILRKIDPTKYKDQSEQIIVYITVMKNYKIVDFHTDYQILATYHRKGYYQGCAVVLTRDQMQQVGNRILLTLDAYDRKKDASKEITVEFKNLTDTHLQTKFVGVKDPEEKNRIVERIQESKASEESLLGFKCVVKPNTFITSVYFVSKEYEAFLRKRVRMYNLDLVVVPEKTLHDPDELLELVREHTHGKRVRAITQMGVKIPLQVIKGANIIYVFNLRKDENNTTKLTCIKSN